MLAWGSELPVVGTGDGIEVLKALSAAFNRLETATEVTIPPSIGSGGGIAAVGAGKAALGRVARALTDAEAARGLVYTPVARLPSAIFVHPGAGVTGLTAAQLVDIYNGKIANWKEVGGADVRIRVVRREEADSTFTVLRGSMPGWKDLAITERSKLATSTQEAIETVRLVEGAIGFGPFTKVLEHGTVVLTIDGHHPTDAGYPSSVVLAFIHTDATVTPDARAFMAFAASAAGKDIIRSFGGLPVN
ncbi:MAG TPA: substrate-binding domain-containing protein [Beijerinckiaceae bacterium]|jgi:phosphate transport system substrate-binding protein